MVTYLEHQGYSVSCEVNNCDIVAVKDDELIIIELKKNISVSLLIQAVDRKEMTDSVYIAVPVPENKTRLPRLGGVKRLLRRLEIGLITVTFMKTKTKVEVILHPGEYSHKKANKKRKAIIREIDGRYAELNIAGSPSTVEKLNSYRQSALYIAHSLKTHGPRSPKELREIGTGTKTQRILSDNVYGWFDRVSRGVYAVNDSGVQSLDRYRSALKHILSHSKGKQ